MQSQVVIGFNQLVQLVKKLPQTQWAKLKNSIPAHQHQIQTA